ncbi:hypothetical protein M0R45_000994 [Rubus argutus]|uniref:Uncharacterized protein n=1 Tax=Rubus argutus TaxID=59490 RepID=A0AAW1VMY7_RUBAR
MQPPLPSSQQPQPVQHRFLHRRPQQQLPTAPLTATAPAQTGLQFQPHHRLLLLNCLSCRTTVAAPHLSASSPLGLSQYLSNSLSLNLL